MAHGGAARNQVATLTAQEPGSGLPGLLLFGNTQWQHVADGLIQTPAENLLKLLPLKGILKLGIKGIDVDRQPSFPPKVIKGILEPREQVLFINTQFRRQGRQKPVSIFRACLAFRAFVRQPTLVMPDRLAILAPETVQ